MRTRIELPDFREAWQWLAESHADSGKDLNPLHMRLLGVSGVGKTFLLKEYRATHAPIHRSEMTEVPILYLSIPSPPTTKSIYAAFLKGLGVDAWNGTTLQYQRQVQILCRRCEVKLIFIDEIHHFIDRGKASSYAAAADALKEMLDLLGIAAIFSGAPRSRILFDHNSQLRSRVFLTHRLWPFDLESRLQDLRGFIYALTDQLTEVDREWLACPEVAERIFYATDGIHRNVTLLCKLVASGARNVPGLNYSKMSEIFRRVWSPHDDKLNPFHKNFPMRRLNQVGEPYSPTYLDGDNHADVPPRTGLNII